MGSNKKRLALRILRILIVSVVVFFLYRAVRDARQQLAASGFSVSKVSAGWLVAAAVTYLCGMLPMGMYWHRILLAMGQRPKLRQTLRAYYTGHLGKYVPGKAMVVVIRTGLLAECGVQPAIGAISVFAETLAMMAVGAFLSSLLIAYFFASHSWLMAISLVLMVLSGAPTWPPLFQWIVKRFKSKNSETSQHLAGYCWSLVFFGWMANLVGWLLLASSLGMVLYAIDAGTVGEIVQTYFRCMASVTLATVAGFLSLLPGGILVRELVIEELLAPSFDKAIAIIAAVLLRLTWLFAEAAIAGTLHFAGKIGKNSDS